MQPGRGNQPPQQPLPAQQQQQILREQQAMRQRRLSRPRTSRKGRASSSGVSSRMTAEAPAAHPQPVFVLEQARPPSSRLWALSGDCMTIGRDPSSDIFVDSPGVSRHHADLVCHGRNWSITDAGSTNGTSVNGISASEMPLREGDHIEVGDMELVLRHLARAERPAEGVVYEVEEQVGNISNVAGNQANYYHESNLQFIASRRGRARWLIISGISLCLIGAALISLGSIELAAELFNSAASTVKLSNLPGPTLFDFALGALGLLLGLWLLILGLITRNGVKRDARNLRVDWS